MKAPALRLGSRGQNTRAGRVVLSGAEWHQQHSWVPLHPSPITHRTAASFPLSPKPLLTLPERAGGCRKHSHTTRHLHFHSSNFIQCDATLNLLLGKETALRASPASHARAWVMQDPLSLGQGRTFSFHSIAGLRKLGQLLMQMQMAFLCPLLHTSAHSRRSVQSNKTKNAPNRQLPG